MSATTYASTTRRAALRLAALLGAVALLGACGPKYPNCDTDEHCAKHGEFCVNGLCKECRDASQCSGACATCTPDGTCGRLEGCCTSDLDCPGGKCWMSGATGTCGAACSAEHPCPSGQRCVGGSCIPDVECTDDSACGPGQKCRNGSCVAACTEEPVYFDFDEYVLTSDALSTVRANVDCLANKASNITLEGHCDERGTDEYNLALGQRRANSVKKAMGRLGVKGNRVRTISYGEERPTCSSHGENCWSRNRRVETVLK